MVHWLWGVVFSVDTNLRLSPMRRSSFYLPFCMVRVLILILQINRTNFVGNWYFIMKGSILVHIYLRFGCFNILLLTQIRLELTRR